MTFRSMMRFIGQTCTVYAQVPEGASDAAGYPINEMVAVGLTFGRAKKASEQQIQAWLSLGVVASYVFITEDKTIENGQFILTSKDNRFFRVEGTGGMWYEAGTIPDHLDYPMIEARRR